MKYLLRLIAQIEHINAINELDAIIQVEGIDGTFIGPYDLSGSMGKPGQYDDDDVKKALEQYEFISGKYDKWIGFHVVPPDYQLVTNKIEKGYNFLAFSFDAYFMGEMIRNQIKQIPR